MLKKVIRLNLDDLFLCLGVVTGLFVLIQGVIAAVLLLSAENSGIMISGTVLPIVAGIMALVVTVAAMGVSFEQAIRFGQTRRRALGMELGRSLFMGVCSMGMAALLTGTGAYGFPGTVAETDRPAGAVPGGHPPYARAQSRRSRGPRLGEHSIYRGLHPELVVVARHSGLCSILRPHYRRNHAALRRQGWLDHLGYLDGGLFWPQLVGRNAYFIGDMSQIMVVFWVALTVVGVIWSFWSLLHAAVRS